MSFDTGADPTTVAPDEADYHPIDESMKALLRSYPEALFRLAGCPVAGGLLRMEDTAINVPEQRADHVFVVQNEAGGPEGAVYVEYQLQPRSELLPTWFAKAGALGRQLGLPVLLLVVYLEKGKRTRFPDEYSVNIAGLSSQYRFPAVRLWEHAERIRSGELWPLAPLLVLCEDNPGAHTLREELALIDQSGASPEEQAELLAVALRVAGRMLSRELVEAVFREELPMVRGATIIDDWIAEGKEVGKEEGKEEGRAIEARRLTREVLSVRFGTLPEALLARLEILDADTCEILFRRALVAASLDDLDA
ncbi:MAG: hypothetical protein K0Q72_115 [Armatimonadetes bacterium]|jgi:predicted transposase YdaD|nr:hypothetical protein [Armatimonadota bacterium]